jgi:hypothetical protein
MSNSRLPLSLSAKGLQRLEGLSHESDFTFIVGDKRYPCPSFVAEFLSPRVSSLRSADITIDEFSIETADPDYQFGPLLSIGFGREVSFSDNDMKFARSVFRELQNSELFESTFKREEGEISEDALKARLELLSGPDAIADWAAEAVASHFPDFSVSDFDQLSSSVLESILSHPSLIVEDEDSVFEVVHRRASADLSYFGLLEFVRFEFVSEDCMKRAIEFISNSFESITFGIWSSLRTRLSLSVTAPSQIGRFPSPPIDSKIISSIPEIFSRFGQKEFRLLYRGSRDGFEAKAFHTRCDDHPNTVTLIASTNRCIFGGYTPVAWSSRNEMVSDRSLTSFIFTITNPHNLPAQIFKQNEEKAAIGDDHGFGPVFGSNHDLCVVDRCHTCARSYSNLGRIYANETGLPGNQVLTGAQNFTVQEIEVFELISGK